MEKKTKYILLGLGVVALGSGAFIYFLQKKRTEQNTRDFKEAINSNSLPVLPAPSNSSSSTASSSFPLKKGSSGNLVKNLQLALIRKYGQSILPQYGADGDFGSETVSALASKGLPTVLDSEAYTQIVLNSGTTTPTSSNASNLATALYNAVITKNLVSVMAELKKIKNVSDYTAVNIHFKKQRIGLVRMTLVTALLSTFNSASDKKQINQELYRIGLKYDGSKWSLSGIFGANIDKLVTIEKIKVWDKNGHSLMIPKGTILGEYLDANQGTTEVETLDGKRLFVKTTAISYLS